MKKHSLNVSDKSISTIPVLPIHLSKWVALLFSLAKKVANSLAQQSKFLRLLFSVLMSCTLFATPSPLLKFMRLGTGLDDFPNEGFSCIQQDSYGLMWFGTARGLLRYDGSAFRWYRHQPGIASSLPPGNVRFLYEDRAGQFWVGANGGLAKLERKTGIFTPIVIGSQGDIPLTANNIWTILEDSEGRLWVGTAAGLFKVENDKLVPCSKSLEAPASGVTTLWLDPRNRLWLGTEDQGVFVWSPEAENFQPLKLASTGKITVIHGDLAGNTWIGTLDDGLVVVDPNANPKYHLKADSGDPWELGSNVIHALASDHLGHMWIGTQGGLHQFNATQNRLINFKNSPGNLESLRSDNVQQIFSGRQGLLWIATSATGVDLLNLNQTQIQMDYLNGHSCLAIAKNPLGKVFLGTRAGVAVLSPETGASQWHLRNHTVRALLLHSSGGLYAGTGAGLYRIHPELDASHDVHVAFQDRIWSMLEGPEGYLWLASDKGLLQFNPGDQTTRVFPVKANDANALNYPVATSLALQDSTYLWIGTFGGGLNRLHIASGRFDHYQKDTTPSVGLAANDVVDLHMDTKGRLWIATLSAGLHRWHPEKETFTRLALSSNLHDLTSVAITSDAEGFLWLSTGAGLLRVEPESGSVFRIRPIDGLQTGSALPGAILFHESSEELLVGGLEGLGRLFPNSYPVSSPPPLLFTSFKASQKEVRHLMEPGETIHLTRDHKSFSIQFAVIDYLSHPRTGICLPTPRH